MTETLVHGVSPDPVDTFVRIKVMSDGTQRINSATTLSEPEMLTIRHSSAKGSSGNPSDLLVDRHNLLLAKTVRDDAGVASVLTVSLTVTVPRSATFDQFAVDRAIGIAYDLFSANEAALLRGES